MCTLIPVLSWKGVLMRSTIGVFGTAAVAWVEAQLGWFSMRDAAARLSLTEKNNVGFSLA